MRCKIIAIAFVLAFLIGIIHSPAIHAGGPPITTPQSYLSGYCSPASSGQAAGVVEGLAPWYCNNVDPLITNEWMQYFPLMFVAVTISYSIAAVIFMFGIALRNDRLRTFGMGELYEAGATALIAILFTFVAAVMFGLLPSFTVGAINPYDSALDYIASTINVSYSSASNLFYVAAVDASYNSFNINAVIDGSQVNLQLEVLSVAFFYLFFWPAFLVVSFMFEAMMSLYTQFYLIVYFMYAAIPVFLIPGVIFRALIPTRNLGGMMMATAIGFYFIMPVLFSVAYYFTSTSIQAQLAQTQAVLNKYANAQDSTAAASSPSSPLVVTLTQTQGVMGSYWLSILFFPALILAMTYMLITQMAEILGGMGKTSAKLRALV